MNDENQDPTTPEPEAASNKAPEKPARRRPSRGQLLVATGALVSVLAVGGAGFAVGRTTAGDDDHPGRPGHSERFDRGPGHGPMMIPPAMPRDDCEES
jgi:hypothetical protein